ncbi:methyl-accepting chemotaxis protein [Marinobacter xestospongiae]|uniref:Methyl-accepting chemotaxis protein n=1 Tax=Marinobacter xestospongiae TaxID=994319 RepID=A0ABU3VYL3_9GAMM|nr:methyl-accepting chemotaxis protein [Marinobacter xestospongiae]MDV2079378.1 methyl-accepting chemotaxis protein [Marinobacter xestospongiae]
MLRTVRSRILFFSSLSILALAALAALAWTIMTTAEQATHKLVQESLTDSWALSDLEEEHRHLQDLAYRIKAQLLLWDEIDTEFERIQAAIPRHWQRVQRSASLAEWTDEHRDAYQKVEALLAALQEGIEERSYYQAGKVVDFQLFPSLDPMLKAIAERRAASRADVEQESSDLLAFLVQQQRILVVGSVAFLIAIVAMTLWLRALVIVRLQRMEGDLRAMEASSDLTCLPVVSGRDEVAGVGSALSGLVGRFEQFIHDIRHTALSVSDRSETLEAQAEEVQASTGRTRQQISDVNQSMAAIADQASAIEQATQASDATVRTAVESNREVQDGLRQSEEAAEHAMTVIDRVATSISVLNDSSGKIEQVIGVIADIAEQTNLLALNAAIEAARAGESGRGFAVVADEVRNLSRRTGQSTGEIRQWVNDLLNGVREVESLLSDMRDAGSRNSERLDALKLQLGGLRAQFEELARHSEEINGAIALQREEIDRVGRRARALDESAGLLTDSVANTRQVSDGLREASRSMTSLASSFTTAG